MDRGGDCRDGDLKRWLRGRLISDSPGKWVSGNLPFSLTLEPQGPDSMGQRALCTHPSWPAKFYLELCPPQRGGWFFQPPMVFLPARTPILPDSLGGSGTPQSSLLELRRTAFPWPPRHHCGYSVARTVCGGWCEGEEGLDGFFGVMSGSQDSIGASLGGGGRRSRRLWEGWGGG